MPPPCGTCTVQPKRPSGRPRPASSRELDSERFARAIESGDLGRLTEALSLWRGPPLSQFAYEQFAQNIAGRSDALKLEVLRPVPVDAPGATLWRDEALKLDPRHLGALLGRGHHLFNASRFEAAENDFATLLAIRPSGFDSIWLSLSRFRRGLDGNAVLEQGVARLKDGEWPAPILRYLLGRLDGEALIAATANVDENKRKSQQCEARFYMAARLITVGQNGAARPLLEKARDECPRDYIEYDAALAELKKLQ